MCVWALTRCSRLSGPANCSLRITHKRFVIERNEFEEELEEEEEEGKKSLVGTENLVWIKLLGPLKATRSLKDEPLCVIRSLHHWLTWNNRQNN